MSEPSADSADQNRYSNGEQPLDFGECNWGKWLTGFWLLGSIAKAGAFFYVC